MQAHLCTLSMRCTPTAFPSRMGLGYRSFSCRDAEAAIGFKDTPPIPSAFFPFPSSLPLLLTAKSLVRHSSYFRGGKRRVHWHFRMLSGMAWNSAIWLFSRSRDGHLQWWNLMGSGVSRTRDFRSQEPGLLSSYWSDFLNISCLRAL